MDVQWAATSDAISGHSSPANDLRSLANLLRNTIITKPRRRRGLGFGATLEKFHTPGVPWVDWTAVGADLSRVAARIVAFLDAFVVQLTQSD